MGTKQLHCYSVLLWQNIYPNLDNIYLNVDDIYMSL